MITESHNGKTSFWRYSVLKFPFTDESASKRRPALAINDLNDGDIIVCRITSKLYDSSFDVTIENWQESGLLLPSVVRVHKIATLEKRLVELKMGQIDHGLKSRISNAIKRIYESPSSF